MGRHSPIWMPPVSETKPRLIDQQSRVALPAEVLKALSVKRGDYVVFRVDKNEVKILRTKWSVEP